MLKRLFDAASVVVIGGPPIFLLYSSRPLWALVYFIAVGSLVIKAESSIWKKSKTSDSS